MRVLKKDESMIVSGGECAGGGYYKGGLQSKTEADDVAVTLGEMIGGMAGGAGMPLPPAPRLPPSQPPNPSKP